MNKNQLWLGLIVVVLPAFFATTAGSAENRHGNQVQLLVMLHQAAPHYRPGAPIPNERHGTAVAGVMVARAGNGIGTIGVAPAARLLISRACWESKQGNGGGICNSFTIAKALQFVLKHDVKIINLSIAGPSDRLLQRLIEVAYERGIVVVGAFDENNPSASFSATHPGVITVAHAQQEDLPLRIIRAPGQNVLTTLPETSRRSRISAFAVSRNPREIRHFKAISLTTTI